MIKRTVEISRAPAHLSARLGQLQVRREREVVGSIPCEDIGVVLVDQPQTTYSHAALSSLADSGAVLVVCGRDHMPSAVLLPLADHSQVVWRIADQVAISKPLRKRLWKQLVQAKLRAQAKNLPSQCPARNKLLDLARSVRSGDPTNVEAQGAKVYWRNWYPEQVFRRDIDAGGLNAMLNYGYAVVRAATARAIIAAGLQPALGLFHSNRSNAFCLADDLLEPLRPIVDDRARALHRQGHEELTPECKAGLLEVLTDRVITGKERGPLMVSMHYLVASLVRCYCGEANRLEIPQRCDSADTDACGCS